MIHDFIPFRAVRVSPEEKQQEAFFTSAFDAETYFPHEFSL